MVPFLFAVALASFTSATNVPPRGIELGVAAKYAYFPLEENFWETPISHAFPVGGEISYQDGQGMAYGIHALRGPARQRYTCFNAPSCYAYWWQAGVDIRRSWRREHWQWSLDLNAHYSEAILNIKSRQTGRFSVLEQSGVGFGAGASAQHRWGQFGLGPVATINLESSGLRLVGLVGLRATYFLEWPNTKPSKTVVAPHPATSVEDRKWSAEVRGSVGAWGWREFAHLRAGYRTANDVSLWLGAGWGSDDWLCSLKGIEETACGSSRIRTVAEVRYEVLRSTFLSVTGGLFYRWANSREAVSLPRERTVKVFREEYGVELAPAFHRYLYRGDRFGIDLGIEGAILVSESGGFANRSYWLEDYGIVAEPRALLSLVLQ